MTIIRRYTPPTCTLEIKAKHSPLSRWSNRPLYKDLNFELRFDDPRIIQDEQVKIMGDQTQLELLYEVVSKYVQKFIQPLRTFDYLLPLKNPHHQQQTNHITPENHKLETAETAETDNSNLIHLPSTPYLQSQSLIAHELYFGSLNTDSKHISIQLTALQLFDLATALENYQTDIKALPDLSAATKSSRQQVFALWRNVAGIILTVGLTTIGLRAYYQQNTPSNQIALKEENNQNTQPLAPDVIAPLPPPPPPATNLPNFPPLKSTEKLPPPQGVPVPKAPTDTTGLIPAPSGSSTKLTNPNLPAPPVNTQPNIPLAPPSTPPQINIPLTTPSGNPNLPKLPSLSNNQTVAKAPTEDSSTTRANSSISSANNNSGDQQRSSQNEQIQANSPNPQTLTEVKAYFQQQWQPPEQLTQAIQYRLLINQDGSMAQITPMGSLSGVYLDRTNMPLMGEKFVSPFTSAPQTTIRLVLLPDGKVDVFQE
jgi:hypothetical protein